MSARREATACSLRLVLDGCRQADPSVHSTFVPGKRRRREGRFGEGSHWHGDAVLIAFAFEVNGGTTHRAKVKPDLASAIPDADVDRRRSRNFNSLRWEPGLGAEDTTRPSLTGQTVANGNAKWLNRDC